MTTIYFVRHCQSDHSVHEDRIRPLTPKGMENSKLVTEFLKDKKIDAVLSSPYRRAMDTVRNFAESHDFTIQPVEDFRERSVGDRWVEDFMAFVKRHWEDRDYREPGGESLRQAQARNIAALREALEKYEGKTLAIGTHGTALSSIINFYQPEFGFEAFWKIVDLTPWVVKFTFSGHTCLSITGYDLFEGTEESFYKKSGASILEGGKSCIGVGLYVKDSPQAVELYKAAFGLELGYHVKNEDGTFFHSELNLGSSPALAVVEEKDGEPGPVELGVTFGTREALDKAFGLLQAGGTAIMSPCELPWSPWAAIVADRFGVRWFLSLSQHRPDEGWEP